MKITFFLAAISLVKANVFYDLSKEDYDNIKKSRDFTGKVVLVTGSNSGIGEGIVKLFSVLGANVVVTGRNAESVKNVSEEVQELSPKNLKVLILTVLRVIIADCIIIYSHSKLSLIWSKMKT